MVAVCSLNDPKPYYHMGPFVVVDIRGGFLKLDPPARINSDYGYYFSGFVLDPFLTAANRIIEENKDASGK